MMMTLLRRINPWSSLGGLPTLVYWLALATFINRAGTMVMPFMLLYLTRYLHWDARTGAGILFLYGLSSVVAGPVAGRLCDRYGCGRVVCCSLFLSSVMMLFFPLAQELRAVVLVTVVLAFSHGAFRPANLAIQAQLLPTEQQQRGFTLNRLAVNAGMSVGPAVGGLLAGLWFPAVFVVDGISGLFAAMLLSRLVWNIGIRPEREETETSPAPPLDRSWLALLAGSSIVVMGFFQIDSTLALTIVENLGMRERDFGLLFTFNTILILLFEAAINQRTATWNPRSALLIGAVLSGVGLGATCLVSDMMGLLLATAIWTLGEIIFFPAQLVQVTRMAPSEQTGLYMGYLTSTFSLSFATSPIVGVYLYRELGQNLFWPIVFLVCLVGGLVIYVGTNEREE